MFCLESSAIWDLLSRLLETGDRLLFAFLRIGGASGRSHNALSAPGIQRHSRHWRPPVSSWPSRGGNRRRSLSSGTVVPQNSCPEVRRTRTPAHEIGRAHV